MSDDHPRSWTYQRIYTLIARVRYGSPAWWGFLTLGEGPDPSVFKKVIGIQVQITYCWCCQFTTCADNLFTFSLSVGLLFSIPLFKQTTSGCPFTYANNFWWAYLSSSLCLSAEQSKLQLTQSTSDNAILTEYAMRFHNLTIGTCPPLLQMSGHGGGTMSRRTANKKLTKLYWPSRKRSPKRLIVLLEPKKWRGTTNDKIFWCPPPLSHWTGAPKLSYSFRCHWTWLQ